MSRIRSIKPEFWEDEEVALLSRDARLLYIATWNAADDEGLLRWSPSYLKALAFIYDDDITVADVAALMTEITDAGFMFPYRGGKAQQSLAWIPSFRKHQKPNRPQPSKLPPPSIQNPAVRNRYAERDGWSCGICGGTIPQRLELSRDDYGDGGAPPTMKLHIDHIRPRCKGGSDYPSNLQATHGTCNLSKNGTLPDSVNDSLNGTVNDAQHESDVDEDAPNNPESLTEPFTEPDSEPFTPVVEGRGEERRGAGGEQENAHRLTPPARLARLDEAVELLLLRDGSLDEAQTKASPHRWLAAARRGRTDDHRNLALTHLTRDPTLTAEALADLLEPPAATADHDPARIPDVDPDATGICDTCHCERNRPGSYTVAGIDTICLHVPTAEQFLA